MKGAGATSSSSSSVGSPPRNALTVAKKGVGGGSPKKQASTAAATAVLQKVPSDEELARDLRDFLLHRTTKGMKSSELTPAFVGIKHLKKAIQSHGSKAFCEKHNAYLRFVADPVKKPYGTIFPVEPVSRYARMGVSSSSAADTTAVAAAAIPLTRALGANSGDKGDACIVDNTSQPCGGGLEQISFPALLEGDGAKVGRPDELEKNDNNLSVTAAALTKEESVAAGDEGDDSKCFCVCS